MISPHGTEHPHGTQDIPHIYHDIPPWYWTPPWYSRYPPTVLMISPTVLNTPRYWAPHGTAHTLYRVVLAENLRNLKCDFFIFHERWRVHCNYLLFKRILLLAFQTIFRPVDWTLNEFFIVYVWDWLGWFFGVHLVLNSFFHNIM